VELKFGLTKEKYLPMYIHVQKREIPGGEYTKT
jgi:hypothetical protein